MKQPARIPQRHPPLPARRQGPRSKTDRPATKFARRTRRPTAERATEPRKAAGNDEKETRGSPTYPKRRKPAQDGGWRTLIRPRRPTAERETEPRKAAGNDEKETRGSPTHPKRRKPAQDGGWGTGIWPRRREAKTGDPPGSTSWKQRKSGRGGAWRTSKPSSSRRRSSPKFPSRRKAGSGAGPPKASTTT
ncbi:hypothetical protein DIPPA_30074 [Diplonema papillatum]|nr:hypothetical protein DIPPA_30074 [Diplonema papillatum]